MRNKIIIIFFLALILGLALASGGVVLIFKAYPQVLCNNKCQISITGNRQFFADELIISGSTAANEPFLLRLDLNRKKVGESFQHYYYADLVYRGAHRQLYTGFLDISSQIQPKDFLKSISIQMESDLSAREHYGFSFNYNDLMVNADIPDLSGDFLVKNTLEYTKYVSEGNARMTINGNLFTMHAALAKIYTPDYSKYVFFDGYDKLKSLAQFFAVWDEQGNFYLLDTSAVADELPDYKSHTWALYKTQAGFMKKAFSASVDVTASDDVPQNWKIYISDLDVQLDLKVGQFVTDKQNLGIVSGTATTVQGTFPVQGYFSYEGYGR